MSANVIDLPEIADEGESSALTDAQFYSHLTQQPILGASITELTATLQDEETLQIINNRDNQDILGDNGGSVDANGILTLKLLPPDNVVINSAKAQERHLLTIKFAWVDSQGVDQNGTQKYRLRVAAAVAAAPPVYPGWPG